MRRRSMSKLELWIEDKERRSSRRRRHQRVPMVMLLRM